MCPLDEVGWYTKMTHNSPRRQIKRGHLTMLYVACYRLAARRQFFHFHQSKKLFRQYTLFISMSDLIVNVSIVFDGISLTVAFRNRKDFNKIFILKPNTLAKP